MTNKTVVELVQFQLRAGTNEAAFAQANQQVNEFLKKQPGYQSRELLRDGEGFIDIVHWDSHQQAQAAAQKFPTSPECAALMAMIAPESAKMRHLDPVAAG